MKEYLTTRGVEFDAINVQMDPAALDELDEIGVRTIPVVRHGDDYVIGMSLEAVDEFLGLDTSQLGPDPDPAELVARIGRVMRLAVDYGRQLPSEQYHTRIPGRDRSYLELVAHIVGHSGRFTALAATPGTDYSDVSRFEPLGQPPADASVVELATCADQIQGELEAWWAAGPDLSTPTSTHFGDQTLGWMLLSTAYSVVQHTRQLAAVLQMLDIEPDGELTGAELQNLGVPRGIWDEAVPD